MATIGERLKEARIEAGYSTPTDAARAFKWNVNTYRSAENNHQEPGRKAVLKYARALGVSVDWLLTGRPPKRAGSHAQNLTGVSATGSAGALTALIGGTLPISLSAGVTAEMLLDDDSMIGPAVSPKSVFPGDILVIDAQRPLAQGSLVVAKDGNRVVVRWVGVILEARDGGSDRVGLLPGNPDYATMEVAADRIVGTVVGIYRRMS